VDCLIVDDSAVYLDAARDHLERQGVTVIAIASTGDEALRMAAAHSPDFALVDVDLGDESGLDVARALATSSQPVPVILISAYPEADLQDFLEASRAIGFLPKSALSLKAIDELLSKA
jgi:DNA-binding NarL/FixJ family response regulator